MQQAKNTEIVVLSDSEDPSEVSNPL